MVFSESDSLLVERLEVYMERRVSYMGGSYEDESSGFNEDGRTYELELEPLLS